MPDLTLAQGRLSAEITLRPFSLTLRRDGRRLLRNVGLWVAEGHVNDHFVQWTEGVVASEELGPHERATRAELVDASMVSTARHVDEKRARETIELNVRFEGGRLGQPPPIGLGDAELFTLELSVDGKPLRLAVDWDRRSEEHFVGLGARHGTEFDQRGRAVQLGADRRYTGPDCPPGDALRGRHSAGRLRAHTVDAFEPRVRGAGAHRCERDPL